VIDYLSRFPVIQEIFISDGLLAFGSAVDSSHDRICAGTPPFVLILRSFNKKAIGLHGVLEKVMSDTKTGSLIRLGEPQVRIGFSDNKDKSQNDTSKFFALSEKKWLTNYQPILNRLLLSAPASEALVVLEPFPRTVYTSRDRTRLVQRKSSKEVRVEDNEVEVGCKRKAEVAPEKLHACDVVKAVETLLFGNDEDTNVRTGRVTKWVAE